MPRTKTCAGCKQEVEWKYWTLAEERKSDGLCSRCLWHQEDQIRLGKLVNAECRIQERLLQKLVKENERLERRLEQLRQAEARAVEYASAVR